jgi:hypothetical protein
MHISLTIFLFRSGIAFYFHLFSSSSHCKAKKKIYVFMVTCQKNLGLVGIKFFFFYTIGKTGNSRSGIWFRYFICEISGKPSFVEAVLWRVLCSQFRQKASGWINKTLLLIKQHITYMNISRYANIDTFVNIRYIFLLARRAYSWLFQLAQMWKLLAPGVGLGDFLTPALPTELGQKTARCESLRVLLPYVEWDRFVTLAGSKSGLRVTLSYLSVSEMYLPDSQPI